MLQQLVCMQACVACMSSLSLMRFEFRSGTELPLLAVVSVDYTLRSVRRAGHPVLIGTDDADHSLRFLPGGFVPTFCQFWGCEALPRTRSRTWIMIVTELRTVHDRPGWILSTATEDISHL